MAMTGPYFDSDPRPRRSPRLYAEMESVPGSVTPASLRPAKPTALGRKRLARDLAIYLAIEGGMSFRVAGKAFQLTEAGIFKAYRRMVCRKSRV
jgi:hypothetical protein